MSGRFLGGRDDLDVAEARDKASLDSGALDY